MRVIAGASPDDRRRKGGYTSLGAALVLFGLLIAGIMLAPNLVLKINARKDELDLETFTPSSVPEFSDDDLITTIFSQDAA